MMFSRASKPFVIAVVLLCSVLSLTPAIASAVASVERTGGIPKGEICGKTRDCSRGLQCVGNEGSKKCMKPMGAGMACGKDPFWICAEGLICENRVCKIPRGGRCDQYAHNCTAGLQCAGNNGTKKCVKPMGPGMKCQLDPYWTCASGLVCEHGTCKIRKGQKCDGYESNCTTGLQCAGNNGTKKCVKPMGPGMKCQLDPYWTCASGLVCEHGTCKIRKGQKCDGYESNCTTGLQCAGNNGTKKCVKPMGPGMKCQLDPYWTCATGLVCEHGTCKIRKGQRCDGYESSCTTGLECAGNGGTKKCVKPMGPGMKCQLDPYWTCATGLVCEHGTCRVPKGGNCDRYANNCASGLQCAGNNGTKKCVKPMGPGMKCQLDPYWTCATGLVCEHGTCKIRKGQKCDGYESNCTTGLQCAGNNGTKKCVKPMGPGMKCQLDPYWTCASGLVCEHGTCKVPKGGNCDRYANNCASGLQCAGNNGTKKCVKSMGPGMKCQGDPFWTCATGLICEGVCRTPEGGNCSDSASVCRSGTYCVRNGHEQTCRRSRRGN